MSATDKQAALVAAVKQVFGTSFIGFTIATTLYGVTVLQTYFYYRRYTKDHWIMKTAVGLLWLMDTLTTAFVAHSLYTFFVLNFTKNPQVDLIIPWSFTAEKLLVTLITFVAQCFYAHTIWRVGAVALVPGAIFVIALTALALGLVTTEHLFKNPLVTSISERKFSVISGLVQGFASLDDIMITVAMIWFLRSRRDGISKSTQHIVDTLVIYAVSRGILTAITQILFLVLNVALPHDTYWQPFHQAVGKLYVNSVLSTLNVRSSFVDDSEIHLGSRGLQFASDRTPSTGLYTDTTQRTGIDNNDPSKAEKAGLGDAAVSSGFDSEHSALSAELRHTKNPV